MEICFFRSLIIYLPRGNCHAYIVDIRNVRNLCWLYHFDFRHFYFQHSKIQFPLRKKIGKIFKKNKIYFEIFPRATQIARFLIEKRESFIHETCWMSLKLYANVYNELVSTSFRTDNRRLSEGNRERFLTISTNYFLIIITARLLLRLRARTIQNNLIINSIYLNENLNE